MSKCYRCDEPVFNNSTCNVCKKPLCERHEHGCNGDCKKMICHDCRNTAGVCKNCQ